VTQKKPSEQESDSLTSRYFLMSGLLHAFYWMDEGLQNHFKAAGFPKVSRTQSMIMANLADGITRPSELARRIGISRQAVQQLLVDMEQRKLVRLVPDPDDARAKIVRYNSQGLEIGQVAINALTRIDAEIENRLGRKALLELRRILVESDWGEPVQATEAEARTQDNDSSIDALVRHTKTKKPIGNTDF